MRKRIVITALTVIALLAVSCAEQEIPVTDVTVSPATLELTIGQSSALNITVSPADAVNYKLEWTSSKLEVAIVSNQGVVTAMAEGSATIIATAGGKQGTCTVKVMNPVVDVKSIALNKESLTLVEGESESLTATVKPDDATDKTVTWSSSDETVATVDQNGKVVAVKPGTVTISAQAGDQSASCKVTVEKKVIAVTSVTLDQTTMTLVEGESGTLTAMVKPDDATDKSVTWSSSDETVATVDQNGKVLAVKPGTATISAQAGGQSASCKVTVEKKVIAVTSVTLDQTELTLTEGETATLVATVKPDDTTDKSVTWSSSDETVATVDQNGKVLAIKPGAATITAQAGDQSATCEVTVEKKVIAVTSITLDQTTMTLVEGESGTLTATVKPDDATDKTVTWSSSDETVATVDQNGKVLAIKSGTATITAQAGDQSASCAVKVKELPPDGAVDLGLSVNWATCNLGASKPEDFGDYYAWGETESTKKDYSWNTYKWCMTESINFGTLTKYNTQNSYGVVDNKIVLEAEDDVAHVKLGNKWRMPTDSEWTELHENCTLKWTSLNGVEGCLVIGTNGNFIFLPAAGYKTSDYLDYAGSYCIYWSSSLNPDEPDRAWRVNINYDYGHAVYRMIDGARCCGRSVRPVTE